MPSPPLPARHTATTPGPRAQRLQDMFGAALAHTLAKISPDNFAACYPTVAARAPHVLRQVQRGMVDRLGQLCEQEFARVLDRYAVVPRLNELEGLVSDAELRRRAQQQQQQQAGRAARRGKERAAAAAGGAGGGDADETTGAGAGAPPPPPPPPLPPHLLPAEAVLAAHLAPRLASLQSQMNARLQNAQAANAALWAEVQAQRAEVDALLSQLESALADVDGAAALLDGVPAEELARESRAVEAEMADV